VKLLKGLRDLLRKNGPAIIKAQDVQKKRNGTRGQQILEVIAERNGPSVARVMKGFIDQYPFREIANTPGFFFPPDHDQIKAAAGLPTDVYWRVVNSALAAGYLKKEKMNGKLMFEIQFRALDGLLDE
jgi:hypothetical protein